MLAQKVRLEPATWNSNIYVRMELLGCVGNYPALGMASGGVVTDQQLSSSTHQPACPPQKGRVGTTGSASCDSWCPLATDPAPTFTVDMRVVHIFTAVALQGQAGYGRVRAFEIDHSHDNVGWTTHGVPGKQVRQCLTMEIINAWPINNLLNSFNWQYAGSIVPHASEHFIDSVQSILMRKHLGN